MNIDDYELHISRIIAGDVFIFWNKEELIIKKPTRDIKYRAEILYKQKLEYAKSNDMWEENELMIFLEEIGVWYKEDEDMLKLITNDIEEFKVGLYKNYSDENKRKQIKNLIVSAKQKQEEYLLRKHSYDHLTCRGFAISAKNRFIISNCVYDILGEKIKFGLDIDQIYHLYNSNLLNEKEIRELARSDNWKSIWNTKSVCQGVFGCPSVDLTDEQKILINWSLFYESVNEHPEKPSDEIIQDDDAFDGWLSVIKKEQKTESVKKDIESRIKNKKITNANEVFFPVHGEFAIDPKITNSMNSDYAKMIKKQRFAQIEQAGTLSHLELKDVKKEYQMALNRGK